MKVRCLCSCHDAPDERFRADGTDVSDAIAAATACDTCRRFHASALLATDLPCDTPSSAEMRLGLNKRRGNPYPSTQWQDEDSG